MTGGLVLVAPCAAAGGAIGLRLRPVVDRVTAERSPGPAPAGRHSRLVGPVTAALFGATAWGLGWGWSLPAYLALAAFVVVLTFVDLATRTLPRRMVWATGATGVGLLAGAAVAAGQPGRIVLAAAGAAVAFVLLHALHVLARGGFGYGDVRLGAVLGWYLGWQSVSLAMTGLLAGFVVGAATGVVLLAAGRAGRRTEVPFGPALAAGAFLVLLAAGPPL
ncbi:MAG TPA: A24 family peptidase [Acidimicrobiales bacterium]|nr:A24 family peptidase [Acidimicrobiales bacterium]